MSEGIIEIEQLKIVIGVDSKGVDDKIQNVVKKASFSLKNALTTFVAPVLGSLMSGAFIKQTFEEINALDHLSTALGINVERLQMWQGAVQDAGSSGEALSGLWQRMNAMITQAAVDGSGALHDLAEKGVVPALQTIDGKVKDTDTYLLELSDTLSKMDAQAAGGIGRQLGIRDNNLLAFFMQGSGEINAQLRHIKELGVYTHEDVLIAREFDVALSDVTRVLKMSLVPIFRVVTPMITRLGKALMELREHWIVLLPVIALIAGRVIHSMIPAFADLYRTIKPLLTLKMAGALAALIALGLALEDIYVWINGGQSVIGRYLGTWEEFKLKIQPAIDTVEELIRTLKELSPTFGELFKEVKPLLYDLLGAIIKFSAATAQVFLAVVQAVIEGFILPLVRAFKAFQEDGIGGLLSAISELPEKFFSSFGKAAKAVWDVFIQPLGKWFDGLISKIMNFFSFDFAGKVASLSARGGGGGNFDYSTHKADVSQKFYINGYQQPTLVANAVAEKSWTASSDKAYKS